jgi:hypothetical protein
METNQDRSGAGTLGASGPLLAHLAGFGTGKPPYFELERSSPLCILPDMDKYEEYRKRADEAQALADRTQNPKDKAAWLRIAQGWMAMLPKPKQSAEERFDARTKAKGTGQDDSESSH